MPGGFVGVDVFFVISGFLITRAAAARDRADGHGVAAAFWARRARRILPAALRACSPAALATVALVPESLLAAVPRRDPRERALRPELAARARTRSTTSRRRERALARAALLVAVGRGAVLPRCGRSCCSSPAREPPRALVDRHGRRSRALSLAYSLSRPRRTRPPPTSSRRRARGSSAPAACSPARRRARARPSPALCVARARGDRRRRARCSRVATPFPGWRRAAARARRAGRDLGRRRLAGAAPCGPVQFLGDISYSVYLWHWPLLVLAPFALGGRAHLRLQDRDPHAHARCSPGSPSASIEDPVRAAPSARRAALDVRRAPARRPLLLLCGHRRGSRHVDARGPRGRAAPRTRFVAAKPRCFGAAARDPRAAVREPEAAAVRRPDAARGAQPQERAVHDHRAHRAAAGVRVRRRASASAQATSRCSATATPRTGARRSRSSPASARWRGLSITHTSCPLSTAPAQPRRSRRARSCARWQPAGLRSGSSAIPRCARSSSSAISGGNGVSRPADFEAEVRGYIGAWRQLPRLGRADRRDPRHAEGARRHRHLRRAGDGAQARRRAGVRRAALGRARP